MVWIELWLALVSMLVLDWHTVLKWSFWVCGLDLHFQVHCPIQVFIGQTSLSFWRAVVFIPIALTLLITYWIDKYNSFVISYFFFCCMFLDSCFSGSLACVPATTQVRQNGDESGDWNVTVRVGWIPSVCCFQHVLLWAVDGLGCLSLLWYW